MSGRPHHPDCLWGEHPDDTNCYNSRRPTYDPKAVPLPRPPYDAAVWAELGYEYQDLGGGRSQLKMLMMPTVKPFRISLEVVPVAVEQRPDGMFAVLRVVQPPRRRNHPWYEDAEDVTLELAVDSIRLAPKETA